MTARTLMATLALALVASLAVIGALLYSAQPTETVWKPLGVAAVIYTPEQSVTVDYDSRTWFFTSNTTGETVATVGCVTEDSCEVSYRDGAYWVVRVTP